MNKTKKITQGAMMLAIMGALILIDRITAYFFSEIVVLIVPIIIILYSCMQSFKDGLFLCVGVLVIGFLLGNFNTTYLIYVPAGILSGICYSYGIEKNLDKNEYLIDDLIGLEVVNQEQKKLGVVREIEENAAGSLLAITTTSSKNCLIPFVSQFIAKVDTKNKLIVINEIEGLIE